jgi:hypothetical protein
LGGTKCASSEAHKPNRMLALKYSY